MSKMSLTQLVAEMQGKSLTYGWDALVLYDQRKTNELLMQQYIERINSENGYIEPMSMIIGWGEGAPYKEYIYDLRLSAPRLSFENADPRGPAKARLTLDMIGGMIVSAKKEPGGPFFISRLLKVLPVGGPQLWMDQPVTKATVGGLGDVLIDLKNAENFMANFVLGPLAMKDVGSRFKQYFDDNIPAELKVFPLGRLEGHSNGILTPQNFEVRAMKADPLALFGDEHYGEGALMLFITLQGGHDGDRYPASEAPYLIPADQSGSEYTGTLLLSSKVLAEKILKPALESSIGKGLALRVVYQSHDIATTLEATAGGSNIGFNTATYQYWEAAFQRFGFVSSKLDPFAYEFNWVASASKGLRVMYGPGASLAIYWKGQVAGQCKVPATNDRYNFGYHCNFDMGMKLEASLDQARQHVELNKPEVFLFGVDTSLSGSAGHYWNMDGESVTRNHIQDRVKSVLHGVVNKIDIPSIEAFLLGNLLFPSHHALHLSEAFVPGDLAVFGQIEPLRTNTQLTPVNSTVAAGSGFQFSLTPTPTNITWSARDIDSRVSLPHVISSSGYFTAPPRNQLPDGALAIVVTAQGTLDGNPVQSSALVSVFDSMILTNPLYDSCNPGESRTLSAEALDGGTLTWNILTPQWGSALTPVEGEPTKRTYTAGGSSDDDVPFSLDKIEVKQASTGQVSHIHILIHNQAVTTPLWISEASEPASGTVQFELRPRGEPTDPSRVIWKLLGGPGTFDERTGVYQEPASVAPSSFIVVSGTIPGEFQDVQALAAIPLPLSKYAALMDILQEDVSPTDPPAQIPVPTGFKLMYNNYYPIQFQWNTSNKAVRYRLYRWWVPIADITGTEYISNVQGYNRFHLRAVDASGRLSERTPYVYFYPPGYLSSEVDDLSAQEREGDCGQEENSS